MSVSASAADIAEVVVTEDDTHREFLLAALRTATIRCRLMEAELTECGIALKHGMVGPDMAMKWLHDQGLVYLLGIIPPEVGQVAKMNLSGEADANPAP